MAGTRTWEAADHAGNRGRRKRANIEDVVAVAHGQAQARLGADVPSLMETSRSVVVQALSGGAPVYGVNTGFGALADTPVGEADLTALQGAIVRGSGRGALGR
jgi:histidine ammonia-lyase